jgi:hypothetical protein
VPLAGGGGLGGLGGRPASGAAWPSDAAAPLHRGSAGQAGDDTTPSLTISSKKLTHPLDVAMVRTYIRHYGRETTARDQGSDWPWSASLDAIRIGSSISHARGGV